MEHIIKKNKGGRPKARNKRDHFYKVSLTKSEAEELEFRAKALGVTAADILRTFLTFEMPKQTAASHTIIAREQYLELVKIGTNINQIAHALNVDGLKGNCPKLGEKGIKGLGDLNIKIGEIKKMLVNGV
jgi:hypothetical protein